MTSLFGTETSVRFRAIQDRICTYLRDTGAGPWREDVWPYKDGGGGVTRVWEDAPLLEKGGVNFSAIEGTSLPASAASAFSIAADTPFFATGVSLVLHPWNPHVPTIHMNIRYFEAGDAWWFGGGVDLTPTYPVLDEVVAFHRALRGLCGRHGEPYAAHKKACDGYFFLKHRGETRGVGGLFFDHMRTDRDAHRAFVVDLGNTLPDLYRPFLEAHRDQPHTEAQRAFQLWRRSRYVEFNLLQDRGTLFGLQSGGRVESILMSLPRRVEWRYDHAPEAGTPEDDLIRNYLRPRDWLGDEGGEGRPG